MISLVDLCQEPCLNVNRATAFAVSSNPNDRSQSFHPVTTQNAESPGSSERTSTGGRRDDVEPQDVVHPPVHFDHSDCPSSTAGRGSGNSDPSVDCRGGHSTLEDRRAESSDSSASGAVSELQQCDDNVTSEVANEHAANQHSQFSSRNMGPRHGSRVNIEDYRSRTIITGPKYFCGATFAQYEEDDEPADEHRWHQHAKQWSPVEQPGTPDGSATKQSRNSHGPNSKSFGTMGSQSHSLRQETHWQDLPRGIRNRFRLHEVGAGTHQQSGGGHRRLRQLHHHSPSPGADRDGIQPGALSESVESAPFQDALNIQDLHEGNLLKEALQGIPRNQWGQQPLDLLEVYAYPNSQLTEVAQQQGTRARRFTLTDGDLETRAGQLQLLRMVLIYRPRHLWVSPECGPWRSWNQFNSRRSLTGYNKVHQSQENARVHLKLCNLLSKIQISSNRHIHLESPWQALTWKQPGLSDLMRCTKAIQLDQCMFGLRHPETKDPMQKRTRIQSSSSDLILALDHRLCNRKHAQINCRYLSFPR